MLHFPRIIKMTDNEQFADWPCLFSFPVKLFVFCSNKWFEVIDKFDRWKDDWDVTFLSLKIARQKKKLCLGNNNDYDYIDFYIHNIYWVLCSVMNVEHMHVARFVSVGANLIPSEWKTNKNFHTKMASWILLIFIIPSMLDR